MKTFILSSALLLAALAGQAQSKVKVLAVKPAGIEHIAPTPELRHKRAIMLHRAKIEAPIRDVEPIIRKPGVSAAPPVAEIRAFPNPFTTQIDVIITDAAMAKSVYKASLYDVNGKLVHSETLHTNQSSLQLPELDAGMYFLQVEKNGALFKQEKFVKM